MRSKRARPRIRGVRCDQKGVAAAFVLVALLSAGCYGEDSNLTESGKGKPRVVVDFPATAEAGSTQELTIEVTNPGPGAMPNVFVAFTLVGVGGAEGVAQPLVVGGPGGRSPSVEAVDPEPIDSGEAGTVYKFASAPGGAGEPFLPVGKSVSLKFRIELPERAGSYANSLQVYDGSEPDRAGGFMLEVEVT